MDQPRATAAVSFDDLARMATAELVRSQGSTVPGRRMLVDLIDELRATPTTATSAALLDDRGWHIAALVVQGFGGIGNAAAPLRIEFGTGAGLTVVKGDNGSGKSSLVSALEAVLGLGRRGASTDDLWKAELISDGVEEGTVELHLVRGADTLRVHCRCPRSGEAMISAQLTDMRGEHPVELGGAWRDALAASNGCFGYAALQARLQKSADLQSYLEELLLLGPVWQLVHDALDGRSSISTAAQKNAR